MYSNASKCFLLCSAQQEMIRLCVSLVFWYRTR